MNNTSSKGSISYSPDGDGYVYVAGRLDPLPLGSISPKLAHYFYDYPQEQEVFIPFRDHPGGLTIPYYQRPNNLHVLEYRNGDMEE